MLGGNDTLERNMRGTMIYKFVSSTHRRIYVCANDIVEAMSKLQDVEKSIKEKYHNMMVYDTESEVDEFINDVLAGWYEEENWERANVFIDDIY